MEPKRILVIGHTYTAPINRLKFNLVAEDPRFELLLLTPQKWRNDLTVTDNVPAPQSGRYRTVFVPTVRVPGFGWHHVLYLIPGMAGIIHDFHPHLIYCEQEPICLVSGQTALLAGNIPVIFFSWENIQRTDLKYRLLSPVRALCYRKSRFMVAGSEGAARVIRGQSYRKPVYITPILGVSEGLFFPDFPRSKKPPGVFTIGYLGRFAEQKGVDTLLEALTLLEPDMPWRLVLVGGGPCRRDYENFVNRRGMAGRVEFHGAVPHDLVPEFLRGLDALVLPSRSTPTWKEQFGHILIEAMACGVPVVGSSSGEIPVTIGEAGLLFQEGEAGDLEEKLRSFTKTPRSGESYSAVAWPG